MQEKDGGQGKNERKKKKEKKKGKKIGVGKWLVQCTSHISQSQLGIYNLVSEIYKRM